MKERSLEIVEKISISIVDKSKIVGIINGFNAIDDVRRLVIYTQNLKPVRLDFSNYICVDKLRDWNECFVMHDIEKIGKFRKDMMTLKNIEKVVFHLEIWGLEKIINNIEVVTSEMGGDVNENSVQRSND